MNHDGTMFFGGGFMLIFWILLILVVIYTVKAIMSNDNDDGNQKIENPLDMLNQRYARGEIDDQEYERQRLFLVKSIHSSSHG